MIKKINFVKKTEERKNIIDISENLFLKEMQLNLIEDIYNKKHFLNDDLIIKNLKKKLNSYKNQDQKKDRYDKVTFIKYNELLEKLFNSKLKCDYCEQNTIIMYKNKREPHQWTLDRIDNSIGHSNSNTIISCLKCNLERRCKNDKKFKFSKQMRIIKKN